jgi:hypothetical protein
LPRRLGTPRNRDVVDLAARGTVRAGDLDHADLDHVGFDHADCDHNGVLSGSEIGSAKAIVPASPAQNERVTHEHLMAACSKTHT